MKAVAKVTAFFMPQRWADHVFGHYRIIPAVEKKVEIDKVEDEAKVIPYH